MAQARRPLLEIDRLSVRLPAHYGETAVLDDVTLAVDEGEALGLVGESGSGKTLLGLATLGLLPRGAIVTGSIQVAGTELVGARESDVAALRGAVVSLIYQDALSALNPNRRIGAHFRDVWRSSGRSGGDWRAEAIPWCERVLLRHPERILDRYAHELSGGMRQRVLIALALFRSPRLVIADEPTTALDRVTARGILALLRELQSDLGTAMILISHDLSAVRVVCERLAVLYAGQICELGRTRDVTARPLHRYTAALLASVESLRGGRYPLVSIPGVVPTPSAFVRGCRFIPRCPAASVACSGMRPIVGEDGQAAWCFHPVEALEPTSAESR